MASVTKRGNKWCVRYRYEDETGRIRDSRVSGFTCKEDAWAAARDLEQKSRAGIDVHGDQMSCAEIMERWYADHCHGLAATTKAKYSAAIDKLSDTFIGDLPVRKLNTNRFQLLIDQLTETVSVRTAVSNTEPLRLSLAWAVRERLIPVNPLANVTLPKVSRRAQVILSDQDVDELLAAAVSQDRRCRAFYVPLLLALYGGLRREECAGLRWESVDFNNDTVTISEAVTMTPDGKHHVKDPKTDLSARTISMPAWVMDQLRIRYEGFLARSNAHTVQHNPNHRVCVTSTGDPYSCASYAHALLRLIREINERREKEKRPRMPEASFHDLRHTHAAMCIRMNIQPKIISERLGHSSIKITMDLYGYLMPGLQQSVADAFNREHDKKEKKNAG